MTVSFAKSLDRPVDVFGVKGRWLGIFIAMAAASVVLALVVGFSVSSGAGICTAIVLVVASFIFCLTTQGRIPSRRVSKFKASALVYPFVGRHETLCRILLAGREGRCWFYGRCPESAGEKGGES